MTFSGIHIFGNSHFREFTNKMLTFPKMPIYSHFRKLNKSYQLKEQKKDVRKMKMASKEAYKMCEVMHHKIVLLHELDYCQMLLPNDEKREACGCMSSCDLA